VAADRPARGLRAGLAGLAPGPAAGPPRTARCPKAYFKGLNLLLNEQQDKAIDAFIEAVQNDPDTTELHFALGNLFRRRGEFERAVRVHQHLLGRADLGETERDRAQYALAQDFMKAGLFDRAEEAYRALLGTPFDTEARLALLNLYERSRDWHAAAEVAAALEHAGTGSFGQRIAHYWCELALEADADGPPRTPTRRWPRPARPPPGPAPPADRRAAAGPQGQAEQALAIWNELRVRDIAAFALIGEDYVAAARPAARRTWPARPCRRPTSGPPAWTCCAPAHCWTGTISSADPALLQHLQRQPTLGAAAALLQRPCRNGTSRRPGRAHGRRRAAQPCSATAAPPAASRPSAISGNAPAA
jgi:lipopolysaccharide biosynthesis regulator YciM